MLKLLAKPNFLMLFLGRIITNIGDSLYYVASMWLVHEIGGNPFYTGLAGFLILLPKALQFLTGPLVDRWRIKKVLVVTQLLQAVFILIIPIAYLFDFLSVTLILIAMPIIACIEEFAYPTQTKALPIILKRSELIKGNALFSFAYQGVDIVFNAISGLVVASFGAVVIYLVDSVTFAIAAICFSFVKLVEKQAEKREGRKSIESAVRQYGKDLREGISVVFRSLLWVFLLGSMVANFAIGMTMAIMPVYAEALGGVKMYGILLTALSVGSLIGALLGSVLGKFRVGPVSIVCFALGALSWSVAGWLSTPIATSVLFALAWVPIGAVNVLFAGVHQSIIPNRLLGRVNSVTYSMSIIAMPLGSLLGGSLATVVDSRIIFACTGTGILFIALVWLVHPVLRILPKAEEMDADTFRIHATEDRAFQQDGE